MFQTRSHGRHCAHLSTTTQRPPRFVGLRGAGAGLSAEMAGRGSAGSTSIVPKLDPDPDSATTIERDTHGWKPEVRSVCCSAAPELHDALGGDGRYVSMLAGER